MPPLKSEIQERIVCGIEQQQRADDKHCGIHHDACALHKVVMPCLLRCQLLELGKNGRRKQDSRDDKENVREEKLSRDDVGNGVAVGFHDSLEEGSESPEILEVEDTEAENDYHLGIDMGEDRVPVLVSLLS